MLKLYTSFGLLQNVHFLFHLLFPPQLTVSFRTELASLIPVKSVGLECCSLAEDCAVKCKNESRRGCRNLHFSLSLILIVLAISLVGNYGISKCQNMPNNTISYANWLIRYTYLCCWSRKISSGLIRKKISTAYVAVSSQISIPSPKEK